MTSGRPKSARRASARRLSVWPPLPPDVYARRPRTLPFPLAEPTCRIFALGRHALWHGARAAGLRPGDEILVPAYHHGSEVEALVQLGLECRFYGGGPDLEPDESELSGVITSRTRALLLIHYLGFPQRAAHWRRWCDERGLMLVEDAAQAWLAKHDGRPVGSSGDVAIFCLYKTFGLPDGAAVVSDPPAVNPPRRRPADFRTVARRHAAWLRGRLPMPVEAAPADLEATTSRNDDLALGAPAGAAPATTFLLRRLTDGVPAARRANYAALLARFPERTAKPFDTLPAGASPFVFPLETSAKRSVLLRLRQAGIHPFDFWSFSHPLARRGSFPAVDRRRERTIGLPVHQELRAEDVAHVAEVVADALDGDGA